MQILQLDRLEEARKLVQGLVRKYPNYAEAHAVLAAVLWKEGSRSKAEEQFSEATSREPKYSDIRYNGQVFFMAGSIFSQISIHTSLVGFSCLNLR